MISQILRLTPVGQAITNYKKRRPADLRRGPFSFERELHEVGIDLLLRHVAL